MLVILQLELMLPHRIRLRGPWQAGSLSVRLPDEFDRLARPVTVIRNFGWPAPLAAHERVWLVLEGLTVPCQASLNGQPLPSAIECDVTPLLRERNELRIELSAGARWDETALEVRAQAWLLGLKAARSEDRLTITGRLDGTAAAPLDLYAILNRRTVIQAALDANGQSFALVSEPLPAELWQATVRVECMCGAVVWHTADIPITGT